METTKACLIKQQFCKVEASARSKSDLFSFFSLLKQSLSNLLNYPLDENYHVLNKENNTTVFQNLNTQEVRAFFMILGYQEKNNQYVFTLSDENRIKVERCLRILEDYVSHNGETIRGESQTNKVYSDAEICYLNRPKEPACSGRVKELLLAKHMKKEQTSGMVKGERRNVCKSSDFAFNTNGYFHQSSTNRGDARRNRCFRDMFHQQDHDTKGWTSSGLIAKLV